jgi:hypothetical protein
MAGHDVSLNVAGSADRLAAPLADVTAHDLREPEMFGAQFCELPTFIDVTEGNA